VGANTPVPVIPALTSIAVNFRNSRLIADEVLPRVPVAKQDFRYLNYALADSFTIPDTKVGRTSQPGQASFGGTALTASTVDYALDSPVPTVDVENAAGTGFDPEARATEVVTNLILLDREVRTSNLVFTAGNYAAANQVTLSHTWDDFTDSTPIQDITSALDAMIMRANIMVVGRDVATTLQTHPDILKAYFGNLGDSGIVPTSFLASLFGLDAFLVGEGWLNSAKPGQTPTTARVWQKKAALIYRDSLATADTGTSFGLTAQFGGRIAGRIVDQDMGMRGGVRIRVGESLKELITANTLGTLFVNAHS
jgi:hypothetical protein